jgi:hypothetical protein
MLPTSPAVTSDLPQRWVSFSIASNPGNAHRRCRPDIVGVDLKDESVISVLCQLTKALKPSDLLQHRIEHLVVVFGGEKVRLESHF